MSEAALSGVFVLAALVLLPAPAAAQVQRCEGADGKPVYVSGPCPQGTRPIRSLPPTEAPSAAERKAAQQRAHKDAGKAAALERERKAEDLRIAREQQRSAAQAKKDDAHCRRLQTKLRHAQEDLAAAPLAKRADAQRRARRAEEAYAADCVAS